MFAGSAGSMFPPMEGLRKQAVCGRPRVLLEGDLGI